MLIIDLTFYLLFTAVLLDRQSVKQQFETRFLDLVECTYKALVEKGIDVHHFLLLLKYEHRQFFLQMNKETTLDDLWMRLNSVWNFLKFDLLELVISYLDIEDLRRKMESYKHDLQLFRKSTRFFDFTECWPVHREPFPEMDFQRLSVAVNWDWNSFTLEQLYGLEGSLASALNLPKFAFLLEDIKPNLDSIVIIWLVPASFVNALVVSPSDARVGVAITQTI